MDALRRTAVLALLVAPAAALGWWNGEWSERKLFRIDTSGTGVVIGEPIGAAPVLVRLHVGNFKFEAAKEDGSDLRFVAGDDRTPLKHHAEKFDALLGEALIWVALPDLKPGGQTDFWLYYGNPKAASAGDSKGTYDPSTVLVYHFGERGQPPRDSTQWGNHAATVADVVDGAAIGQGLRLDGKSTLSIPVGPALNWKAGAHATWSAWIRPAEAMATGVIFSRREGAGAFRIGLADGKAYVEVAGVEGAGRASAAEALAAGEWHHLAVAAGDAVALYLDGAPAGRLAARLPPLNSASQVGGESAATPGPSRPGAPSKEPLAEATRGFRGDLDELRIANVERPAGYIRVSAIAEGSDPGRFLVAGAEESHHSWGGGTLAVIIRSVTADGWVVIALLGVMAAISWMVMVEKGSTLRAVRRANARFMDRFRKALGDPATLLATRGAGPLGDEDELEDSPLYRLYRAGAEEVRRYTAQGQPLTPERAAAVRSSMEAVLAQEADDLADRMVLLTIAISGGPFLGLLGTVIGVMITFASIAAAGDVNVTAIAPGIAAALVATVAGLAVAIPSLFGYNWLLTRIKSVNRALQAFTDEFVARCAAARGSDGPPLRGGHSAREAPASSAAAMG